MFISKTYRPDGTIWPWYTFLTMEFMLTVALLALFGIADPNLYRTKLWQQGADLGFNSSPKAQLYAAANYQSYKVPHVWSQFITSYNVVISVLSMFIMLTKSVLFILQLFPPWLSVIAHGALVALYALSAAYQAGPDMSDPDHPQPGPPWYITKSCSVATTKSNVGYCKQAKSAFACTIVILCIFGFQTIHGLISMWPSRQSRALHSEKASRSKSAYAEAAALTPAPSTAHRSLFPSSIRSPLFTPSGLRSPGPIPSEHPSTSRTWGMEARSGPTGGFAGLQPMTPRTQAFNRLGGTKDLPLRNHFSSPNAPRSPTFGVKSPLSTTFESADDIERGQAPPSAVHDSPALAPSSAAAEGPVGERGRGPMYFPPPPKVSNKAKK